MLARHIIHTGQWLNCMDTAANKKSHQKQNKKKRNGEKEEANFHVNPKAKKKTI